MQKIGPVKILPILSVILFPLALQAKVDIDKTKYITIDEIRPEMKAWCLTVYDGVKIEQFELKVISVVRDYDPGHDAILVMGVDERFKHTGPVAGCSGSPVFIDGRLAGALAFGWSFSKDPLYGVTPIEEMLQAGQYPSGQNKSEGGFCLISPSEPINLQTVAKRFESRLEKIGSSGPAGAMRLLCPVSTTLPSGLCEQIKGPFEKFGFMPLAGGGRATRLEQYKNIALERGSILAVPLCEGDFDISAIGTITEVVGDKIYGFGHAFENQGQIDLPMGTGYVHTVVSNIISSFKFGQMIEVKGALQADESTAVYGVIGKQAATIPVHITIDRYDDARREYNCKLAVHRYFTPLLARAMIMIPAYVKAGEPQDNTVYYDMNINLMDGKTVSLSNVSVMQGAGEAGQEAMSVVGILLNNPWKQAKIESLDIKVEIVDKTRLAKIDSIELADRTIEPGGAAEMTITLDNYHGLRSRHSACLKIPENIQPGSYRIQIGGFESYQDYIFKNAAYKFKAGSYDEMISALNNIAAIKRDKMYVIMELPRSGMTINRYELSDLPATRMMLLADEKRTIDVAAMPQRLEQILPGGCVIDDGATVEIEIEK